MTIQQIYNWRSILRGRIGPYADICSNKEIEIWKEKFLTEMETIRKPKDESTTSNTPTT